MSTPANKPPDPDTAAELERLRRINAALMRRVEKMTDVGGDAFGLFQNSLMLERQVQERTARLEKTRLELETSNVRLRTAKEAAEELAKAKAQFLATMSHEIRTPLNGILGVLQLVMVDELPEHLSENLEIIASSADALRSLLDEILDYSKLDAGCRSASQLPINLRKLSSGVRALFSGSATQHGIGLACDFDPALDRPGGFLGDSGALRQVLANLVGNAVKFTPQGEVRLALRATNIDAEAETTEVELAVHDTGIGMDEADLRSIFQPFSQVESTSNRRFGGTGLGLAICQKLVHLMGGQLSVESKPGSGSTFRFSLQLAWGNGEADAPKRSTIGARATPQIAGRHVLVAEDHPVNQMVTRRSLERLGCTVDVVANGQEALDALADGTQPFDIVLMDVQMPGLDGLEATRLLRARPDGDQMAVIALTANALSGDREICLDAGMNDYLAKPVRLHELQAMLEQWLPAR